MGQSSGGSGQSWFLYDGHGSTRALADSAGSLTDRYDYDAYGVALGFPCSSLQAPRSSLLFSGEQFDADLQYQYLRARYYASSIGCFNRLDPYAGNRSDPQSLHKYAYCHGDPVNGVDPTGLTTGSVAEIQAVQAINMTNLLKVMNALRYVNYLRLGLRALFMLLQIAHCGIQSIPPSEWVSFSVDVILTVAGDRLLKAALRPIGKHLLKPLLKLPATVKTWQALAHYLDDTFGIAVDVVDDLGPLSVDGSRHLTGGFRFNPTPGGRVPTITLYRGGHCFRTMMHEFWHYVQYLASGQSAAGWGAFADANRTALEKTGYFIGWIFQNGL